MRFIYGFFCLLLLSSSHAQGVRQRLSAATERFMADVQMQYGIAGISVVNSTTGETIYDYNAQTGLAPASCQKVFTSAAAFELLGAGYRYKTVLGYDGTIVNGILKGNVHITGSGDPSFGSWRYASTKETMILNEWVNLLKKKGIEAISGSLTAHLNGWEKQTLPGGWIWDDIGNYYGAGSTGLNWRENQYDLVLRSGNAAGDPVAIVKTVPQLYGAQLTSELLTGPTGSGDNAYIYLPPYSEKGFVRGSIPAGEKAFTISGSLPDPVNQFLEVLSTKLKVSGINNKKLHVSATAVPATGYKELATHLSPTLDSLNYWFMQKSINLYGEAFLKTIAYEKLGTGSTEKGVELLKAFWKARGVDPAELHITDGSGLSPQNRVTTSALVKALQYARGRLWFHYYYDALPLYNDMKLKSGTIGGVKSFAGYHTSKNGTTYTIAIIVNNYDGSASALVRKMYQVLDVLK